MLTKKFEVSLVATAFQVTNQGFDVLVQETNVVLVLLQVPLDRLHVATDDERLPAISEELLRERQVVVEEPGLHLFYDVNDCPPQVIHFEDGLPNLLRRRGVWDPQLATFIWKKKLNDVKMNLLIMNVLIRTMKKMG